MEGFIVAPMVKRKAVKRKKRPARIVRRPRARRTPIKKLVQHVALAGAVHHHSGFLKKALEGLKKFGIHVGKAFLNELDQLPKQITEMLRE